MGQSLCEPTRCALILNQGNIIITVPPRDCDVMMFESLGVHAVLSIEVRESRF